MYFYDENFVICGWSEQEGATFITKAKRNMRFLAAVLAFSLFTTLCAVNPYDPGTCRKRKRGKFVVVKDRNDDDKIVVCVRQHGKYLWEVINGHSYGNYFDPAKDCSAVVDNVPNPESGIYWIKTKNGPIKAWCDVDTDNGGFILIGVKDTPETWAIPSNFSLVHPKGPARWSSAFGDKKVLDFRIQISTSKDFHDTRAHWYYRFKSPRLLSKLLMSNEGGCSHQYPGIGNISYLKNLMTRKIVTRNFRCSQFGASIAHGLGWDKMNNCFKQACPSGFAYLFNYHIDTSGSYSYSVKSGRSGIQDNQTSFIGCDHGKCCACFGPDSNQDYCAPKCQPINGGTVLKEEDNITVWFWIRPSLPKRVWKQCMEFKEKNEAGKMETWRVEDGVKRKGPCSVLNDITINDGIAVVANNESMNKLPKVEGLLSYLLDERKLYLNERSKWEALANQKEVKDVFGKLKSFKQEMNKKLTTMKSQSEKKNKELARNLKIFKQQVNQKFTTVNNKFTKVNEDVQKNKELARNFNIFKQQVNQKFTTVNNKFTKVNEDVQKNKELARNFNIFKQQVNQKFTTVNNKFTTVNQDVQLLTHQSCKKIWMTQSNPGSGVYRISVGKNQIINAYCQMSSISGCSGGGWTLVMKIDGSSSTFRYDSSLWTGTSTYNDNSYGRNGGLDNRQFKGSTYWRTSFKEICVGMRYSGVLRAVSFSYPASSLYRLIADGRYRRTHLGRHTWKSLIHGSSLQYRCNQEGFNVYSSSGSSRHVKIRLGFAGNNENDCTSLDSFVGLGASGGLNYPWSWCGFTHTNTNVAGNLAQCSPDNGNKNTRVMAYVLVR